jgi:RimJ/RimL family protein N-acetyltransferase
MLTEHAAANERAAAFYEREGFALVERNGEHDVDDPSAPVWRRRLLSLDVPSRDP